MKPLSSALLLACLCCLLPNSPVQAQTSAPKVEEAALRAHLALLSSDLFEGRGTGQRGGALTMAYLETQAAALGLQPANGKSFRQKVQLTGITPQVKQSTLHISAKKQNLGLQFGKDWLWNTRLPQEKHHFQDSLVFAGYGVSASEENWDDFKGQDVRGKILVLLTNDPQPTASEPNRFGGKALSYYGRRSYKYEEAARRGAKGVLLIHHPELAISPWKMISEHAEQAQFMLKNDLKHNPSEQGLPVVGWLTEEAARKLFAASGQDFDSLRAKAETREFAPQSLDARLEGDLLSSLTQIEQDNIAALVPGTDPKLKDEVVIYSAHWDHLGKIDAKPGETGKDVIFNGAVDNGSGTAALLAMAKAAVTQPAKRSQLFLWVAAEEEGLLGSEYYAKHPLFPAAKTAANLNLDTLNFVAQTKDIGTFGAERSDLIDIATQVAGSMQLKLAPPREDTAGVYFRSDHFSFARVGIPAFSVGGGSEYLQEQEANSAKRSAYGKRYHQVSDEYDPQWDLSGMVLQAQFTLNLGRAVADAATMPQWKKGDVFGKLRAGVN